jgi:alpha-L-fucosidase
MRLISQFTVEDTSSCRLQASAKSLQDFVRARYGLSVHWGLYSLNGRGEWVMHTERIPYAIYRERMQQYNPIRFNAQEWADMMLESGQKFLIITAKHHDGFCLWDTQLTDFKVTNTPFKRDILVELAQALKERNLDLHFYYSLLDWTHPAYRKDWPAYVAYYQAQLRELLTGYGKLGGVIFDGYWPRTQFEGEDAHFTPGGLWDLAGAYSLIHQLQPEAVVANNTHVLPLPGEDYQVWELDMPGENTIGFNTTQVGERPSAAWWNLNSGWAYAPRSQAVKSPELILQTLLKAWNKEAVFFLNIGPRPYGDIHPEEQHVLREVGQSLRAAGLV